MNRNSISDETIDDERLELKGKGCMTDKKLTDFRKEILKDYKDYDLVELRRFRQPHYVCVVNELRESGYVEAPQFIEELFEENDEIIAGDDLEITRSLKNCPTFLDELRNILEKTENAKNQKDKIKESTELSIGAHRILNMAVRRNLYIDPIEVGPAKGKGWLWLVRRLLLASFGLAQEIQIDGGQREAGARFLYARFLLKNYPEQDPETAASHLIQARRMSAGLDKWKFREDNGDSEQTLFSAVCLLLRDMYLKICNELKVPNIQEALKASQLAVKRASEANNEEKYSEAITERGHCKILLFQFKSALEDFNEALAIQMKLQNVEGICEALINVALALQKMKKIDESKEFLEQILELAQENNLSIWLANAHWRLGELMVRGGRPQDASELLLNAYGCFGGAVLNLNNENALEKKKSIAEIRATQLQRNTIIFANVRTRRETIRLNLEEYKNNILYNKDISGFLLSSRPKNVGRRASVGITLDKRASTNFSLNEAIDFDRRKSSMAFEGFNEKKMKKQRKRKIRTISYFLDDGVNEDSTNEDDLMMTTYLENTNKSELSHLRCMYGIAKGQEFIEKYFQELEKCNTVMESRVKIIEWKLEKNPNWMEEPKEESLLETEITPSVNDLQEVTFEKKESHYGVKFVTDDTDE